MRYRISRRLRWILASAAGLVAVSLMLLWNQRELSVVVYNNTQQAFQNMTVSVGMERRERPGLDSRESAIMEFRSVEVASDLQLFIAGRRPLRWTAPGLVTPSTSRLTLRIDDFGGVTVTVDKTWSAQWAAWLE